MTDLTSPSPHYRCDPGVRSPQTNHSTSPPFRMSDRRGGTYVGNRTPTRSFGQKQTSVTPRPTTTVPRVPRFPKPRDTPGLVTETGPGYVEKYSKTYGVPLHPVPLESTCPNVSRGPLYTQEPQRISEWTKNTTPRRKRKYGHYPPTDRTARGDERYLVVTKELLSVLP